MMWLQVDLESMKSTVGNFSELSENQKVVTASLTMADIYAIKDNKTMEAAFVADYLDALVGTVVLL